MRKNILIFLISTLSSNAYPQVANSVLASGSWYKVAVVNEGIYKLTYSDLQSLGIDVSAIDPRNISMYGYGGGMLPTANNSPRPDDLTELAIMVSGESDSTFNVGDYVLFYGQSQHRWRLDSTDNRFHHILNLFSDTTYYFLTVGTVRGKRIDSIASSALPATDTVTSFDDYAFHELDSVNLLKSGQAWYGEEFNQINNSRGFQFIFPNHVDSFYVQCDAWARSVGTTDTCHFILTVNGNNLLWESEPVAPDCYFCTYALPSTSTIYKSFVGGDNLSFNLTFYPSPLNPQGIGWLNYIEINARRLLNKSSSQLFFRDKTSVGIGHVCDFTITNTTVNDLTWDVTDQGNVEEIQTTFSSGNTSMKLLTDSLRNFAIFDPSAASSPVLIGAIANQNLHGMPEAQLLIITYPAFLSAANNLANEHRIFDDLTVNVATTDQVYNEFSSGSQDITALRDFIRMFYKRAVAVSDTPRYVLLFGDASYDYKYRLQDNSNYVPTYESIQSLDPTGTYCSDDYFAWLDSSADASTGNSLNVDVGVGRIPARSLADANAIVNKIIHYETLSDFGNWRKDLAFVADEGNEDIFLQQTEVSAIYDDATYCDFDQTKIYLDAYKEVNDSIYPDVNAAINNAVDSGCLVIAYVGNGSTNGWSAKQVLTKPMIKAWNNLNRLPFFASVTDDFNCFDDPADTSAGELVLLNPAGGGIASWAGTRLVYSEAMFELKTEFDTYALEQINGKYNRIGDIIKLTKRAYVNPSVFNVTLLGDPAVQLNYPTYNIALTTFNGNPVSGKVDTLHLGNTVTATGEIQNAIGLLNSSFSGSLHILLLRQKTDTTLANDPDSYVASFNIWGDTLYNGNATVSNGTFSFNLTIPNATSPYFRNAKFSFYATNGITDASGCYTNIVAGNIVQGLNELTNPSKEVSVYPNPVIDLANFHVNTSQIFPLYLYIFDIDGRQVTSLENISHTDFSINVNDLAKSMYIFTLEDSKREVIGHGKIIVQ